MMSIDGVPGLTTSFDNPNMSMKRWLQSTRRCDPSYSTSPCVMLLSAVSSCSFCNSSRCCDSRFCRLICRMIRSSVSAIAAVSPQAPAIMARVWSLQSASTLADRRGRDHRDRIVAQCGAGADAVLAVHRARDPHLLDAAIRPHDCRSAGRWRISGRSCLRHADGARSACRRHGTWRSPRPGRARPKRRIFRNWRDRCGGPARRGRRRQVRSGDRR